VRYAEAVKPATIRRWDQVSKEVGRYRRYRGDILGRICSGELV
jgi:hypothetical protein